MIVKIVRAKLERVCIQSQIETATITHSCSHTIDGILGHRSDSKDCFRVQRIQLRDTCFRFLEETMTFQFICIVCVMLLVLCAVGMKRLNFITPSWLVASCSPSTKLQATPLPQLHLSLQGGGLCATSFALCSRSHFWLPSTNLASDLRGSQDRPIDFAQRASPHTHSRPKHTQPSSAVRVCGSEQRVAISGQPQPSASLDACEDMEPDKPEKAPQVHPKNTVPKKTPNVALR